MFIPSEVTRFRNFVPHLSCFFRPNDLMQRSRGEAEEPKLVCKEGKQWREINWETYVKNKSLSATETPLGSVMFINGGI